MSNNAEDINLVLLSNRKLCGMLEEAEREERSLSDRRRELHALIDNLLLDPHEDDFELAALSQTERELSAALLQLQQRILDLRLEKSGRIDGMRTPLRCVESPAA